MFAARRADFGFAADFVATNGHFFDHSGIDLIQELAECDRLTGALRRLEKAPEQEDEDDDDHPQERGLNGGIQKIASRAARDASAVPRLSNEPNTV